VGNLILFSVVKKIENWSRFDDIITISLVAPFLGQGVDEGLFILTYQLTLATVLIVDHNYLPFEKYFQ